MGIDLNFKKKGSLWTAQFEATADFNLHIERENIGSVAIFQRTSSSGGYSQVNNFISPFAKVIDVDIVNSIYPKHYKIVMDSQPTFAVVNSEGEIILQRNKAVAIFNLTTPRSAYILGPSFKIEQIDKMLINDVEVDPVNYYSFPSEGKYKIEYIMKKDFNKANAMFKDCDLIESFDFSSFNIDNAIDTSYMFSSYKGQSLDLSNFDMNNVTYAGFMFQYNANLINLISFSNCKVYIDLSASSKLTHQSLMSVINNLHDLTANGLAGNELAIGSTNIAKLTADEIAIATNKGWTIK